MTYRASRDQARGPEGKERRGGRAVCFGMLLGLVFPLILPGCGSGPPAEVARRFQEAQRLVDAADSPRDFLRAAGIYQEILDAGVVSGAVLYNQGNAYLRAGRRGEAIACYRQALRFRPRDPHLRANLRRALGDDSAERPRSWVQSLLFWQDWWSLREKIYLAALSAAASLVLLSAAVAARQAGPWWRALGVALLLLLFALASAAYDAYRFEYLKRGVVTAEQVVARRGAGEDYEVAPGAAFAEGTEFRAGARRGRWVRIHVPGGREGWVRIEDVVIY